MAENTKKYKNYRKCDKVRKGFEPIGFNKQVWKAQWAMQGMFLNGKLSKSGTVPKNPEKNSNNINSEMTTIGKTIFGLKLKSTECITKNQNLKSPIVGGENMGKDGFGCRK